jgi:hypothetical protein
MSCPALQGTAFSAHLLKFLYARLKSPFHDRPRLCGAAALNDHELPILHHGHIAADRCIHVNDHGRSRGGVIRWEEAAGWPWSSQWLRATTLAISGRPKARPPGVGRVATTSTPPSPRHRHRTRRQAIRDDHPDRRPCRTAPCIPPGNQSATAPGNAPRGPGLGRPRRSLALLVGAAPGCDLAAP